jgi:hypothetical protein
VSLLGLQAQPGTGRVLQSNSAARGARDSDSTTPGACKVSFTGASGAGGHSTLWQAAARQPNNSGSHIRQGCGRCYCYIYAVYYPTSLWIWFRSILSLVVAGNSKNSSYCSRICRQSELCALRKETAASSIRECTGSSDRQDSPWDVQLQWILWISPPSCVLASCQSVVHYGLAVQCCWLLIAVEEVQLEACCDQRLIKGQLQHCIYHLQSMCTCRLTPTVTVLDS